MNPEHGAMSRSKVGSGIGGRFFWLSTLLACACLSLSAQRERLRFGRLGLEDGLANTDVHAIHQDRRGFIWLGTGNGLDRFDGTDFRHFRHDVEDPRSLPDNHISALAEDRDGVLWIGTARGLAALRWVEQREPAFSVYVADLPDREVRALLVDRKDRVWVGTAAGLVRLDDREQGFIDLRPRLGEHPVSCLLEDGAGRIWVGTTGGLHRLEGEATTTYLEWERGELLRYPAGVEDQIVGLGAPVMDSREPAESFEISAGSRRLLVMAEGSGRGSLTVAGALVDQTGPVWQMTPLATRHAGGHPRNRIQLDVIELGPGRYRAEILGSGEGRGALNAGIRLYAVPEETLEIIEAGLDDYRIPSQIAGNFISALHEDEDGRIWIGTAGQGLSRLDPDTETFLTWNRPTGSRDRTYVPAFLNALDDLVPYRVPLAAIVEPGDNTELLESFTIEVPIQVLIVYQGELRDGRLVDRGWLTEDWERVWFPDPARSTHAAGDSANRLECSLVTLSPGTYRLHWLSNSLYGPEHWGGRPPARPEWWGIRVLPLTGEEADDLNENLVWGEERESLADNHISALIGDDDGYLWVGTRSGLSRLDPRNNAIDNFYADPLEPESLSADTVTALLADRGGMIWIGTEGGGVSQYHSARNRFPKYVYNPLRASASRPESGLPAAPVTGFWEDLEGRLYVATIGGLAILERASDRFIADTYHRVLITALDGKRVTAIAEDDQGRLWVGSEENGLFRIPARTPPLEDPALFTGDRRGLEPPSEITRFTIDLDDTFSLASNHITALTADSAGRFWIGTTYGLHRAAYDADLEEEIFVRLLPEADNPYGLSDGHITALVDGGDDTLWIGTAGSGIDHYDLDEARFTNYRRDPARPDSLGGDVVTDLVLDGDGVLWVGTNGGGLNRLEPRSGHIERISERDGLPDNAVLAVLDDGAGGLWVSTTRGIARLDKRDAAIRTFSPADGLQGREFTPGAASVLRDGFLAFGGRNGFNLFDPARSLRTGPPPLVSLTAVRRFNEAMVFDEPLDELREITVSHDENFLAFEFLALDYTNPAGNRYAYMLEGVDPDWVVSGTRNYAAYPNLPHGSFTFRVRAANSDGVWNEEGVRLDLEVTPPFYVETWFIVLAVLLGISLIRLIYFLRVRRLRREKALQEEFTKRLIQSQERERRRIAGELHDSLGQNLLVINNEIQHQLQQDERESHLDELADMVLDAINEVREIAYHLHPHQLERLGLERAVESVINKVDTVSDTHFVLRCDGIDGLFDKDVEINIYRLIQEAINNIIRHAEAAEVLIELIREPGALRIHIDDDGVGFEPKRLAERKQAGIGIRGMRDRLELIGGTLEIKSRPGEGTRLQIRVPIEDQQGRVR